MDVLCVTSCLKERNVCSPFLFPACSVECAWGEGTRAIISDMRWEPHIKDGRTVRHKKLGFDNVQLQSGPGVHMFRLLCEWEINLSTVQVPFYRSSSPLTGISVHVTLLCIVSDRNLHACYAGLVSRSEVLSVIFLEPRGKRYHHLLPFLKWFQRLVEFYGKTMSPYLRLVSPPYVLLCMCVWGTTVALSRGSAFIHWWNTLFRTFSYPGPTEHKDTLPQRLFYLIERDRSVKNKHRKCTGNNEGTEEGVATELWPNRAPAALT